MFQQALVTRAPCFEALFLAVSPLESRGWLTCKQPCQGKMLKSLVGESAVEHYLQCDPWRTQALHSLSDSQQEKSIWRGLQPQLRRAKGIGHRADTSTFSMGGRRVCGEGEGKRGEQEGWIFPHKPRVLLLSDVTGAGTWAGGWVWEEAGAKRTSCWDDAEEEVKNKMKGWLQGQVKCRFLCRFLHKETRNF